jgi:hypothetical protein
MLKIKMKKQKEFYIEYKVAQGTNKSVPITPPKPE